MMKRFNDADQSWLNACQKALDEQYPGLVQEIIGFGSKARSEKPQSSFYETVMEEGIVTV